MSPNLQEYLFKVFGLRDKRVKCLRKNQPIKIDDHGRPRDCYAGFCYISVFPDPSSDRFELTLDNAPSNEDVIDVVQQQGGQCEHPNPPAATITLHLHPKDARVVRQLAKAIKGVVGRGQSYPDPNWKWVCRRAADSLGTLAHHLDTYRRETALTRKANKNNHGTLIRSFATSFAASRPGALPKTEPEEPEDSENLFAVWEE